MSIVWTLEEGLEVVRKFELIAKHHEAHVALGGSVLIKGESSKDLDIMIYAHNTTIGYSTKSIMEDLRTLGLKYRGKPPRKSRYYADGKEIMVCEFDGKRVDIFFL